MRSITVPVVDDQTCMNTLPEFVYWGPFMVTDNCWVSMARTSGSCHSYSYVHSLDFCCTTYSNLSFVCLSFSLAVSENFYFILIQLFASVSCKKPQQRAVFSPQKKMGSVMVCDHQLQSVQWYDQSCSNPVDPTVNWVDTKLCMYTDWIKRVMDGYTSPLPTETTPGMMA